MDGRRPPDDCDGVWVVTEGDREGADTDGVDGRDVIEGECETDGEWEKVGELVWGDGRDQLDAWGSDKGGTIDGRAAGDGEEEGRLAKGGVCVNDGLRASGRGIGVGRGPEGCTPWYCGAVATGSSREGGAAEA